MNTAKDCSPREGNCEMTKQQKQYLSELALAEELDRLTRLVRRLNQEADLKIEVLTEDRGYLRLTFTGQTSAGWGLQREMPWLPGLIVRRLWDEEEHDWIRVTPEVDVDDELEG